MRKRPGTMVLLNPFCSYGTGLKRWEQVKDELGRRIGRFKTEVPDSPQRFAEYVSRAIRDGDNLLIAAGGDGTVNLLLNAVMTERGAHNRITLGAVGLGSSNDFHKPFRPQTFINGIPVRIDAKNAFLCDVIQISYQYLEGMQNTQFCIINASIGITAEANALFNERSGFIKVARKISVEAAIVACALKAMFTYHDIPCQLSIDDGEPKKLPVTNLGIIKNPHFAGHFCYDTPIKPDDGELGINLCGGTSMLERVGLIAGLAKARFQGRPRTNCWSATHLTVESNRTFALELDGEVVRTRNARFKVIPKAVRCCL